MDWTKLKQRRWFKILSNKYLLIIVTFGIWMLFFDSNSWLVQRELSTEINKLKSNKTYYQTEIDHDGKIIEQLQDEEGLERYAREKYFMKKENEDIYIIEYEDSIQKRK